ncbi:hypothetical protein PENSUB_13527 [Penicillium subrubescens]|uniref:Uncharacterized protein n=1 Tax=Penicillium subrubescens TaxID=1316194 RepID=A0A1Q5UQ81_9EURO|nr:hypothetical protein PENSUB_13527 [Penicillium subrubescens]
MSRASSGNNYSRNEHKEPEDISSAESDNTTDNTESEDNIKPYEIDDDRGSLQDRYLLLAERAASRPDLSLMQEG